MSTEEGQMLIKKMVLDCDVLIENYKTGSLKKYGLDYESLSQLNPKLVYCSITGFGQTGPRAAEPGYDFIMQGMGGMMSVTGERDDLPGGATEGWASIFRFNYWLIFCNCHSGSITFTSKHR